LALTQKIFRATIALSGLVFGGPDFLLGTLGPSRVREAAPFLFV